MRARDEQCPGREGSVKRGGAARGGARAAPQRSPDL